MENNNEVIANGFVPPQSEPDNIFRGRFWNLNYWLIAGLVASALFFLNKSLPTPYWFFEPVLFALFVFGYWFNVRRIFTARLRLSPRVAAIAYIVLSSIIGLLYEISVSPMPIEQIIGGGEISFLFYTPFAVLSAWAIHKYRLTFHDAYFVGGVASILEASFFGASALLSPFFFIIPLVIVNYFLVYGMYVVFPLLFIDEKLLWGESALHQNLGKARMLRIGVYISIASWVINYSLGYLLRYLFQ